MKSLDRHQYELAELADLYNDFFNADPPITPKGFGHLKETIYFFTRKRIRFHSGQKKIYNIKKKTPDIEKVDKMKKNRSSTKNF